MNEKALTFSFSSIRFFAFSGTEKCFKIKLAFFLLLLLVDVVCKVPKLSLQ